MEYRHKIMRCDGWLDHRSVSALGRLDGMAAQAGQNELGVGWSGISGKRKGGSVSG